MPQVKSQSLDALSSMPEKFPAPQINMGVEGLGRMGKRHWKTLIYRAPQAKLTAVLLGIAPERYSKACNNTARQTPQHLISDCPLYSSARREAMQEALKAYDNNRENSLYTL
ncbi:hypothetical protein IWX49DRAFT_592251 [Phyllosticta citricarpa]|uniref:Uncharacterized protein n=2 Tax=Phyllosticta TaxID=121621 RepID=A0ABR1MNZ8_9PEZI